MITESSEIFCNCQRIQKKLGCFSSAAFERQLYKLQNVAQRIWCLLLTIDLTGAFDLKAVMDSGI